MAIQIPNPGTGNGATGDNEFVLWTKVKDNFSNTTHAASRLVGTAAGNVMQVGAFGLGAASYTTITSSTHFDDKFQTQKSGFSGYFDPNGLIFPINQQTAAMMLAYNSDWATQMAFQPSVSNRAPRYRSFHSGTTWSEWASFYTTTNTTIVNGSLKPSSPVVKIHTDSLELNYDAERMGVTLNKRGVGDYLLQNTTGLRKDDGWYIELPQDVNGNPYFAVTYNQLENNDIEVKTYKRIFDMNTFMFVPDLDSPIDIKEGRSIAIRFNDLPQDDAQTEV